MTDPNHQALSDIFKAEYSNLIAVLSNFYGVSDLQLAEDIVSETFLKAMRNWSHKGIPQFPKAWLRRVAQNLLYEHIRREKTYKDKVYPTLSKSAKAFKSIEITEQVIADSQLKMIFVLCDPALNREAQLCLALRILCGFSTQEISRALLSNKEAVNKKLSRAKAELRARLSLEKEFTKEQYVERLDNVLRVIYLLFNEGYYSTSQEENIRHDICWEALRLGIFLSKHKFFPRDGVHALVALMCFHASRLAARQLGANGDLLYEEQDRSKWNQPLIEKGQQYLQLASESQIVSKYHLEAAIAYWHTNEDEGKWSQILMLYNKLLTMEYAPAISMNRTYALAKAHSPEEAIKEALKLEIKDDPFYCCLLAELYRMNGQIAREIVHLNAALKLSKKENQRELIRSKLERAFGEDV